LAPAGANRPSPLMHGGLNCGAPFVDRYLARRPFHAQGSEQQDGHLGQNASKGGFTHSPRPREDLARRRVTRFSLITDGAGKRAFIFGVRVSATACLPLRCRDHSATNTKHRASRCRPLATKYRPGHAESSELDTTTCFSACHTARSSADFSVDPLAGTESDSTFHLARWLAKPNQDPEGIRRIRLQFPVFLLQSSPRCLSGTAQRASTRAISVAVGEEPRICRSPSQLLGIRRSGL
jgi:hypothetical protein